MRTDELVPYVVRAADELEAVAKALEALPARTRRKILRQDTYCVLIPALIRNEAERARDPLYVEGYMGDTTPVNGGGIALTGLRFGDPA